MQHYVLNCHKCTHQDLHGLYGLIRAVEAVSATWEAELISMPVTGLTIVGSSMATVTRRLRVSCFALDLPKSFHDAMLANKFKFLVTACIPFQEFQAIRNSHPN